MEILFRWGHEEGANSALFFLGLEGEEAVKDLGVTLQPEFKLLQVLLCTNDLGLLNIGWFGSCSLSERLFNFC